MWCGCDGGVGSGDVSSGGVCGYGGDCSNEDGGGGGDGGDGLMVVAAFVMEVLVRAILCGRNTLFTDGAKII